MKKECRIGNNERILDVIIKQEKIDGKIFYVAQGIQLEVASQGLSIQEALENIKDAAEIVIENSEEARNELCEETKELVAPLLTRVLL